MLCKFSFFYPVRYSYVLHHEFCEIKILNVKICTKSQSLEVPTDNQHLIDYFHNEHMTK